MSGIDAEKIIFHRQLYLTVQPRDKGETHLGFMSPFAKDSAFEKRKKTQIEWARNYSHGYNNSGRSVPCDEKGNILESSVCFGNNEYYLCSRVAYDSENDVFLQEEYIRKDEYDESKMNDRAKASMFRHTGQYSYATSSTILPPHKITPLPDELQPRILDNIPMHGYFISREIQRYGWNGGNVVWRVVDPRGFELEISSGNFARIIASSTIENGIIKAKCLWGRLGAKNVLIPEGTEEFELGMQNTVTKNTKRIPLTSVKPGDRVRTKDGNIGIYCGKYYFLNGSFNLFRNVNTLCNTNYRQIYWHDGTPQQAPITSGQVLERYVLKIESENKNAKYITYSNIDIIEIIAVSEAGSFDRAQEASNMLESLFENTNSILISSLHVCYISDKPIKLEDCKFVIRELSETEKKKYLTEIDDRAYLAPNFIPNYGDKRIIASYAPDNIPKIISYNNQAFAIIAIAPSENGSKYVGIPIKVVDNTIDLSAKASSIVDSEIIANNDKKEVVKVQKSITISTNYNYMQYNHNTIKVDYYEFFTDLKGPEYKWCSIAILHNNKDSIIFQG